MESKLSGENDKIRKIKRKTARNAERVKETTRREDERMEGMN